ncbi:proteasome subunit alpha [Planomonospora venezuelensis]|uniref:Proteasome subunit alpha n=1 Tax=Planomonospora venezuelensis TaxID=1999 RepID=A0A841DDU4_PLAVE|nr:proteasome subunit alpha [Planomonospora venezuelensis]MBB5967639.1 proteasome alpha subunit [Planomonospora venezuelensis]
MPFGYASPEQIMRDKADYARKGIARGRSVVVLQYEHGILFVAPNPSRALHKISEIYDRIGFAAVGRYNEFEALRLGGIRYADINGYTYDRTDVTARGLANLYAQSLGQIFTESIKSMEVEVVVAEVGDTPEGDAIYRLTFDGSVFDEHGLAAMGGQAEAVSTRLKERYRDGMGLAEALETALVALTEPGGERPPVNQLEVAVLDRNRPHRKFQRIGAPRLERLLAEAASRSSAPEEAPAAEEAAPGAPGAAPETPSPGAAGSPPATGPEGEIDTGSGA